MSTIKLLSGLAMLAMLTGCTWMQRGPAADNRPDAGTPDQPSAFPTSTKSNQPFLLLD
jgi:hypothetical protein